MRVVVLMTLLALGCGIEESRHGAPTNAPASGLGPVAPLDDATGLDWVPPFILADAARTLAHPSVLVDGDAIDLWVGVETADRSVIGHARTERFEAAMGPLEEALVASEAWEGVSLSSPSVVRGDEGALLFYLAAGKVGFARRVGSGWMRRATPIYADAEPIRSLAAARRDDRVRLALLVGERVDVLELPLADLDAEAPPWQLRRAELVGPPSWATSLGGLGLRIDRTPVGRWREDLFYGVALPAPADLGATMLPQAVAVASRYLDFPDARLQTAPLPVLSGMPYPREATAVAYRGGVLVLYAARSGARDAIGVGRWP